MADKPDRTRLWLPLALVGACLIFTALTLLRSFATAPFASADEAQHVGYALAVADGRLPRLDDPLVSELPRMPGLPAGCDVTATPVPACARPGGRPVPTTGRIYTANHPPLFYVVEAVALSAAGPDHAMLAARATNVVIGVLALGAIGFAVRELVPTRPDLAVGAVAVTAVVPAFNAVTSQVYNDGLAVATAATTLGLTWRLIRLGPAWPRLFGLSAALLAAAATRASGALLVVPVVLTVTVAVAIRVNGRAWWRRIFLGAGAALVPLAVVTAGIGWFYLRNVRLYGDPFGSRRVGEMFAQQPVPLVDVVSSELFWHRAYLGNWGRYQLVSGVTLVVAVSMLAIVAVGAVLAAGRALAVRRARPAAVSATWRDTDVTTGLVVLDSERAPATAAASRPGDRWATPLAWMLLAVHAAVVTATLVGYAAAGGAPFARYLLPGLPVAAMLIAAGLAGLPGARRGLPTSVAVAVVGATAFVLLSRELELKHPAIAEAGPAAVDLVAAALDANAPFADADLLLPLLLGITGVGFAVLVGATVQLCRATVPEWPQLARARSRREIRRRDRNRPPPDDLPPQAASSATAGPAGPDSPA